MSDQTPLSPTLRRDLQHELSELPPWLSARQRVRATCQLLSTALGVPVGVASFASDRGWHVLTESNDTVSSLARRLRVAGPPRVQGSTSWSEPNVMQSDGRSLTLVPLPISATGPATYLMLDGDWSAMAPELRPFLDGLLARHPEEPDPDAFAARRLTSALSVAGDDTDALDDLLRAARAAVPSRFASVAVPTVDGALRVTAASGYPVSIMSTVQMTPGQGLFGEVFRRGQALVVRDVGATGFAPRRPRFRTGACLLVPVLAGARVLAIVALADPDADSYTPDDAHQMLALTAPAALALSRLRSEQRVADLMRAAAVDGPTGLSNRAHFEDRLREEVERSVRHGTPLSVLVVDVDSFKAVNDQYGHATGDQVVQGVADILKRSVRAFDVCARFGGDEFAVLMPGSRLGSATTIAERIRTRIEARQSPLPASPKVTVSIGVAELGAGETAAVLVERADRALYRAKKTGKNRVLTEAV